jgi:hypothetical protein
MASSVDNESWSKLSDKETLALGTQLVTNGQTKATPCQKSLFSMSSTIIIFGRILSHLPARDTTPSRGIIAQLQPRTIPQGT